MKFVKLLLLFLNWAHRFHAMNSTLPLGFLGLCARGFYYSHLSEHTSLCVCVPSTKPTRCVCEKGGSGEGGDRATLQMQLGAVWELSHEPN